MTHFRTWVLCAALALLLAACGRNEPGELVASAKAYLAKRDYAAAAIQLKNALQEEPANGEARYLLGVALLETGDPVSADKELRRALEYRYSRSKVVPELAKAMRQMGQAKQLVAEFGDATLDDPAAQAALKAEIGYAYLSLGEAKAARTAFAAALAAQPGNPKARTGEARILAQERDVSAAMKVVDEVLAQSPAQPEALALKAELLLAQNQREPARQALAQLIRAQPANGNARFTLTSVLIGEKRFDDARAEIEAMKKAVPRDIRSRYLEALLEYQQGNPAKAKESILLVLKVAPEHAPSQLLAGAIELQLKSYVTAEDYLRRVVARYPQNIVARRLLAAAYLGAGQPTKAGDVIEAALRIAPDDPLLLRLAGEATLASGDFARAGGFYERAAAVDKDNAAVRTRLAQVRFAAGDEERAFRDLEAASAIDRASYQADLALVLAHLRKREYDKALAAVAELEKKQPDNPLTYNLKGGVYLAKRDRASARANFEKALALKFDYLPAAANLARMDLADKQPAAARGRFESIVAKDPRNDQALLALAELQAATNVTPSEILATVERAISANPKSVRARLALISFHVSKRDTKAALAAAQSSVNALPDSRELLSALGRVQYAAGETRQAVATFNKLATMMPDSPVPLMLAARAHVAAKDYDSAVAALRKALALSPERLDVHREAIAVLLAAGKPEEALADARRLQKARPKEAVGYMFEGEVLATQKRFDEAAKAYGEALKRQSGPALVARQHALLVAAGKPREADALAARWLKEQPKDHVVRLYLANRDLQRKDYKAAARGYRELAALQPENPVVLNNLAWTLSQLNDPAALEYAEKAYARAPNSPAIADTLGWILVERGDTKRGVELLAKAAAGAPNALAIRLHYAKALVKAGDSAAAKRELESALDAGGQGPLRAEAEELLKQL